MGKCKVLSSKLAIMSTDAHPSLFQRIVGSLAGLYLLVMLVYLAARFTIQDSFWLLALLNSFALLLFLPLPFLVLLVLLARSRRAFLSLVPIILLIAAWFGPRFLPKANATQNDPFIRVMSNNLWRLNPTPEQVAYLALDAQADVIFLQEVQLSTQGEALAVLDADYPYQSSLVDEIRLDLYTAVNLTLSRYPFVEAEEVPAAPFVYRNVIEVDEQRIALYNVHLVAPVGGARVQIGDNYFSRTFLGYDDRQRNQQIDALLVHLTAEPYPFIVAGDFNTSDLSMTYTRLAAQMGDSFAEAGVGLGASWPVVEALGWPAFIPPFSRMDYIWHSDGLRAVNARQGEFVGSDHLPLLVDFAPEPGS
jgi:endonuclease/exonuclease/phosphatase (EEP) superfamily protein YafD